MSFASQPFVPTHPSGKTINLLRGWPAPSLLPPDALAAAMARALANPEVTVPALQYGLDAGFQPLREALASWTSRFFGAVPADPSRVCITGGASQSIANILASYTDPLVTRAIWMVAPCYFLACPIFEDAGFGGRLRAVKEDEEGIDVAALEAALIRADEQWVTPPGEPKRAARRKLYRHVIYLVPTTANPSGKTMPLSRREDLVRLARRHDALIIADDVYDFLQWPLGDLSSTTSATTAPLPFPPTDPNLRLPRLSDVDVLLGPAPADIDPHGFGHAISNGSFSKIVAPGVRTGWVEASPAFIHGLSQTGATCSGGAPSHLSAVMLWELLRTGELESRIRDILVPALRERHRRAVAAIRQHLDPLGARARESALNGREVAGGYFIWITLPEGVSGAAVAERAREAEGLVVGAGSKFEVAGDEDAARFDDALRICFSWEDVDDIVLGIERLANAVRDVQDGKVDLANLKGTGAVYNEK
ncbi:aminotransferase [Plectosphaerella cucumerina]|uniref:Aminotransferase n=1 Tax=Plectosphaerella cucumerina TaxID=40658 RepID=A0A8K0TQK2_9PEZI|nr:aminotransferase [Plectosphaerella cucumerina]